MPDKNGSEITKQKKKKREKVRKKCPARTKNDYSAQDEWDLYS